MSSSALTYSCPPIDLFRNGGLLIYSFICMIISLSDLVWKKVFLCIFHMLTRSERPIIIHIKEYINRPPLWKRSIGCPAQKRPNQSLLYYFSFVNIIPDRATFSFQTPATFHCCLFQSIYSFSGYFLWWEKVNYYSFGYMNGSAGLFISTTLF